MDKEDIIARIEIIENLWYSTIKLPLSGGLDSKLNQELLQLRNDLKNAS